MLGKATDQIPIPNRRSWTAVGFSSNPLNYNQQSRLQSSGLILLLGTLFHQISRAQRLYYAI